MTKMSSSEQKVSSQQVSLNNSYKYVDPIKIVFMKNIDFNYVNFISTVQKYICAIQMCVVVYLLRLQKSAKKFTCIY